MAEVWLSAEEQRVWRAYLRAQLVLQAQLNRQLHADDGLSESDYGVLVHLSEAPDGRLRGKELGLALQWEKSRLSHHLSRMARRGLVERVECPTDGRGAFVVLTPAGRARIESAAPRHAAEVRRWFLEVLGPERLRLVGEASEALLAALEGGGAGCPDADLCDEADGGACGDADGDPCGDACDDGSGNADPGLAVR